MFACFVHLIISLSLSLSLSSKIQIILASRVYQSPFIPKDESNIEVNNEVCPYSGCVEGRNISLLCFIPDEPNGLTSEILVIHVLAHKNKDLASGIGCETEKVRRLSKTVYSTMAVAFCSFSFHLIV
jgi:hypothetical protein